MATMRLIPSLQPKLKKYSHTILFSVTLLLQYTLELLEHPLVQTWLSSGSISRTPKMELKQSQL